MSVRVTTNTAALKLSVAQKGSLFLRLVADAIVDTAEPKTPKKLGNLRRDVLRQVLGLHARVQWRKRYAARQENVQHRNYTTPGTGPHFAENAVKKVYRNSAEYARKAGLL